MSGSTGWAMMLTMAMPQDPMAGAAPAAPPPDPAVMAAADVLARYVGNDQALTIAGEVVDAIMAAVNAGGPAPAGPAPMPGPEQVGARFDQAVGG